MGKFAGSDHRIGQYQAVGLYLLRRKIHAVLPPDLRKPLCIPEDAQRCRQVPCGRKAQDCDPVRIDAALSRMFPEECHCFCQFQKCRREHRRLTGIAQDCRVIAHGVKLHRYYLRFPVRSVIVPAAGADQYERSLLYRELIRDTQKKSLHISVL